MLQDNEGTISIQDQPTGSDIYVSVEMSRSKWVVGIHTSLVEKIGLHTMACGDVNALLALIDRTRAKLIASPAVHCVSSRSASSAIRLLSRPYNSPPGRLYRRSAKRQNG